MPVTGDGQKRIMVVGENPSVEEDRQGTQFVGSSGQVLRDSLRSMGVSLDRDCWKTNAIICRPKGNRGPSDDEIRYCRANVMTAVRELQPQVIIALGHSAVKSLFNPWVGALGIGAIKRWVGWQIPFHPLNAWVCPTFHPSFLLREQDNRNSTAKLMFEQHLRSAIKSAEEPLPTPIDLDSIELVYDADRAVAFLHKVIERGDPIAFDYETNTLKPETAGAQIYSCAVCWKGKKTVAFPWSPQVAEAMRAVLRSEVPKLGANMKFEDRWTRVHLNTRIRNWTWDTMQAAHVLDNRPEITSVKFQSFVMLGVPSYNDRVEKLLSEQGANRLNQIHQIHWRDLLKYNGWDALLEYHIALRQMRMFGIDFNWRS
jgi:DNA polymerase